MTKDISAKITLTGDVRAASFPAWIRQHAARLGLAGVQTLATGTSLEVTAQGAEEMIQALALGASLGPQDVLVDEVKVTTNT